MSCNGCRVLRKGCSDSCILRPCLQWIESPEAQGHATVFVAKFFGRAGMMSFISAVSESQRPALFQSLLYEACGRTVNPVFGAVGLLWSGNWTMCQAAVETVLKGGSINPVSSSSRPSPSAKPHSCKKSGPPPTTTTSLPTTTTSLRKRSHGMMETNNNIDHVRSSVEDANPMPMMGKLEEHNVLLMNKPVVYATTAPWRHEEERPMSPPSGQLITPVPRRVQPQTMGSYGLAAMVMREHQQQAQQQQQQQQQQQEQGQWQGQGQGQAFEEKSERQSHETVELDLTLYSNAKLAYTVRASSPSSFSMNSEGSVISSDTAEFSVCGMKTVVSPPSLGVQEGRQFLHLL